MGHAADQPGQRGPVRDSPLPLFRPAERQHAPGIPTDISVGPLPKLKRKVCTSMRRTALRSTAGGALAVLALMAATTQAEAKVADRGWSASNSFARGSGYIDENNNGFSVSGSVTDYASKPSTSYVYVSWLEYNHGAWTTVNRQASGRATNGTTAGISLSRTTPYDVRRIQVTVCTSTGNWYCGSPG